MTDMTQHDPQHAPTMYVEVDGAIEERPVAYMQTPTFTAADGGIVGRASRAYPVLQENEQAVWSLGSEIPVIIKVRE